MTSALPSPPTHHRALGLAGHEAERGHRGARGRRLRSLGMVLASILALTCGSLALAEPGAVPEPAGENDRQTREIAAIRAALMYKFMKFIEWPASSFEESTSPIVIGVVGKDPFGVILDKTFKHKKQGKRAFRIERYAGGAKIKACHVLYVPSSEKKSLAQIRDKVRGQPVLLIGDWEGFAIQGGVVNFYLEKTKDEKGNEAVTNKFEINPDEAKRRDIKISSQLLKLARIVKDEDEGEKCP